MGDTYCAKASHLSHSIGVLLVRDGVLLADVKLAPMGLPGIETERVPAAFRALKKGSRITPEETQQFLRFLMQSVTATWSPTALQRVPPGVVIEELRGSVEAKVIVGMGEPWGYYVPSPIDGAAVAAWTKTRIRDVLALASKAAIAAGVPFGRVDIVQDHAGKLCISEFDWNPDRNKSSIDIATVARFSELGKAMRKLFEDTIIADQKKKLLTDTLRRGELGDVNVV